MTRPAAADRARSARLTTLDPESWGLEVDVTGGLSWDGVRLADLARRHGTPLHVVHRPRVTAAAARFAAACAAAYRGRTSVHYAMKANGVPAVVEAVKEAGISAEVMTEFELALALRLGFAGGQVIVNGPCKSPGFLAACVRAGVRLVIVDSLAELEDLDRACAALGRRADVLLRVNPDYVPRGTDRGSAAASRRWSVFGLDLAGGEVAASLREVVARPRLRFRGFHLHSGTGIRDPGRHAGVLDCLPALAELAARAGVAIDVLDVGGGYGSPTSREFTSLEMIGRGLRGRTPHVVLEAAGTAPEDFAGAVAGAVERALGPASTPELIFEPGRCIVGSNQLLLLGVHRVKRRRGAGTWIVTDGGIGTCALPAYYEFHEVFPCEGARRSRELEATITGPACFGGDVICRRKRMPDVGPGEVLALMDSGAYFTGLEASFGFARTAIVEIGEGRDRLVRRRETFEDWTSRDSLPAVPTEQPLPGR